jgi:hypothetical protein
MPFVECDFLVPFNLFFKKKYLLHDLNELKDNEREKTKKL